MPRVNRPAPALPGQATSPASDATVRAVEESTSDGQVTADEWRDLERQVFSRELLAGPVGRELIAATRILRLIAATSSQRPDWAGKVAAGGPIDPNLAMKAAVLTGALRRGENVDQVAAKLALTAAERAVLVSLAKGT